MTAIYDRLSATALRLLTQYGQSVTLRKNVRGDYNPAEGKAASTDSTDETRKAVFVDAPQKRVGLQYGAATEANSLVERAIKWIYFDAKGSKPEIGNLVIAQGVNYYITNVLEYNPAGTPLMYLVVARI